MKHRLVKSMTAGVLAVMLCVSPVFAKGSITWEVKATVEAGATATNSAGEAVSVGSIVLTALTETNAAEQVAAIQNRVSDTAKAQNPESVEALSSLLDASQVSGNADEAKEQRAAIYQEAFGKIAEAGIVKHYDSDNQYDTEDTFELTSDTKPLTAMMNVEVKDANGEVIEGAKDVDVTITVENLPESQEELDQLRILQFDNETGEWIIIKPVINEDGTITFHMPVDGPIMVVYNEVDETTAE